MQPLVTKEYEDAFPYEDFTAWGWCIGGDDDIEENEAVSRKGASHYDPE